MATVMVVVRHGPASERGWLGLRMALALGLGGHRVTVLLEGAGAGWSLPVDARAWLGGDPQVDLDGLVEETGAEVLVDTGHLASAGIDGERCRDGVALVGADEAVRRCAAAELVVAT